MSDEYWVSRPLHQYTNTPTLPDPPSHTTISMECGIRQLCVDGSKHALATATILSPFFDTSTCMYRSPAIIFLPRQLPYPQVSTAKKLRQVTAPSHLDCGVYRRHVERPTGLQQNNSHVATFQKMPHAKCDTVVCHTVVTCHSPPSWAAGP